MVSNYQEEGHTYTVDPIITLPDNTNASAADTAKITDTLNARALTLFAIQMGVLLMKKMPKPFRRAENQRWCWLHFKDEFYRVMALAFNLKRMQDSQR